MRFGMMLDVVQGIDGACQRDIFFCKAHGKQATRILSACCRSLNEDDKPTKNEYAYLCPGVLRSLRRCRVSVRSPYLQDWDLTGVPRCSRKGVVMGRPAALAAASGIATTWALLERQSCTSTHLTAGHSRGLERELRHKYTGSSDRLSAPRRACSAQESVALAHIGHKVGFSVIDVPSEVRRKSANTQCTT